MTTPGDGLEAVEPRDKVLTQRSRQFQELVARVVGLLDIVVGRLRTPLLVVCLAPVVVGISLVVVTLARGGPDVPVVVVVVAIAWIAPSWLAVRRSQLIRAVSKPDQTGDQLYAAFGPGPVWNRLRDNLIATVSGRTRLAGLGRVIWRGVRLSTGLRTLAADSPVLAPFFPGRLRGLVLLSGWCLASFATLSALLAVKSFTALLGVG